MQKDAKKYEELKKEFEVFESQIRYKLEKLGTSVSDIKSQLKSLEEWDCGCDPDDVERRLRKLEGDDEDV